MKTFKQSLFGIRTNEYIIEDEGVRTIFKSPANKSETFYEFEYIGDKQMHEKTGGILWLIIAGFFALLTVLVLGGYVMGKNVAVSAIPVWGIAALFCYSVFRITRRNSVFLCQTDGSAAIEFMVNKPSADELNVFMNEIIQHRNEFILANYGEIDPLLPYEKNRQYLNWVYELKLFTKEEYNSKLEELEQQGRNGAISEEERERRRVVGFGQRNETEN